MRKSRKNSKKNRIVNIGVSGFVHDWASKEADRLSRPGQHITIGTAIEELVRKHCEKAKIPERVVNSERT